jgi:hypothetical protein
MDRSVICQVRVIIRHVFILHNSEMKLRESRNPNSRQVPTLEIL